MPEGFGAAYNLFSAAKELLLEVECGSSSNATLTVGNGQNTTYIYRFGYEWVNGGWKQIALSGSQLVADDWYVGSASANLSRSQEQLADDNLVVAYTCVWQNNSWKCGCRDSSCTTNYWQLQAFRQAAPSTDGGLVQGRTEQPGEKLTKISSCANKLGNAPGMSGALMGHAAAAFDETRTYTAYLSTDLHAVVTKFDGTNCTPAERVNVVTTRNHVHNYPSVHVDSKGYIYMTYFGRDIPVEQDAPYIRKSQNPHDISSWGPEQRARLFSYAEVKSLPLRDGSLMLMHNDANGTFDIIEPGSGTDIRYRHSAARGVVAQDPSPSASPPGCDKTPYLNRFSKVQFDEGPDGTLYATWGWGGGYYDGQRPAGLCNDIRHYSDDSHEIWFAYSSDGGIMWKNRAGTKSATSVPCPTRDTCWNKRTTQILFNDPAFRISTNRQTSYRAIWAAPDGTIYIAYAKSRWCNSGLCNQSSPTATEPGSLRMLKFKLGSGPVTDVRVDAKSHSHIAGLKEFGNALYIYAENKAEGKMYEYKSTDDGAAWSKRVISTGTCSRLSGHVDMVHIPNAVRLAWECNASGGREIYQFRKAF